MPAIHDDASLTAALSNPFRMPKDEEVFALRERERLSRAEEKQSIYEKSTVKRRNFRHLINEGSADREAQEMKDLVQKKAKDVLLLKKQAGGTCRPFRPLHLP